MTGRPLKLTTETDRVERFLAYVEEGVTKADAALAVGIHRDTFNNWQNRGIEAAKLRTDDKPVPKKDQPFLDFLDGYREARAKAAVKMILINTRAAVGGDVRAAQWWLTRRRPEDWTERYEISSGDDPLRIELVWGNGNGGPNGNGNGDPAG